MTNCDCWTDSGTPPIEWVCVECQGAEEKRMTEIGLTFTADEFIMNLYRANKRLYEQALDTVAAKFNSYSDTWTRDENGNMVLMTKKQAGEEEE
jgi:hypothetical protein